MAATATNETMRGAMRRATHQRKKSQVFGRLRVLVDPKTGEEVRAVAFMSAADIEQLRERNFKNGDIVKLTLTRSVDPYVNRLAHALGKLVVQNIDGFQNLNAHQALKRLQVESGVHCEPISVDGDYVVNLPISLSFDETDDSEFRAFAKGISNYLVERYWPETTTAEIEDLIKLQAKVEGL